MHALVLVAQLLLGQSATTEVVVLNSAATALPSSSGTKTSGTIGRTGLEIQNLGPNAIYCAFSAATAVVGSARKIAAGESWALDASSRVGIWCIAATADQAAGAATIVSELKP